jgi:hypothetical protein
MKIENLNKVNELSKSLKQWNDKFKHLEDVLKGKTQWTQQCRISIGGDVYGNGRITEIKVPLQKFKNAVDEVSRLREEAWGKVVGIRAELRSMGVEP